MCSWAPWQGRNVQANADRSTLNPAVECGQGCARCTTKRLILVELGHSLRPINKSSHHYQIRLERILIVTIRSETGITLWELRDARAIPREIEVSAKLHEMDSSWEHFTLIN